MHACELFGLYRKISDLGLAVLTLLPLGQYGNASVVDFPASRLVIKNSKLNL